MKQILADTGPLFALADPNDQFHQRAHEESLRLEHSQVSVVIAFPTVVEAYNLILRRLNSSGRPPLANRGDLRR